MGQYITVNYRTQDMTLWKRFLTFFGYRICKACDGTGEVHGKQIDDWVVIAPCPHCRPVVKEKPQVRSVISPPFMYDRSKPFNPQPKKNP